jgi:hypothetical protein
VTKNKTWGAAIVPSLLFVNAAFWAAFAIYFATSSHHYEARPLKMDDAPPFYVITNRAVTRFEENQGTLFRLFYFAQAPTTWVMRPAVWLINREGGMWERTYWGTSPGGYLLLAEALLSFGQWFLIGKLVEKAWRRAEGHSR